MVHILEVAARKRGRQAPYILVAAHPVIDAGWNGCPVLASYQGLEVT